MSAAVRRRSRSPHSEPNQRSVMPSRASRETPAAPNASPCAAQWGKGNSNTASAPPERSICARTRGERIAAAPRWVKQPLITRITASAPSARGTIHQIQMPRMGRIAFADNARDSHSSSFPCVLPFIIPVFCLFVNHFGDFGGQKAEKVRKNS